MKIWITKYALSGGITEHDVDKAANGYVYPGKPFFSYASFKIGVDAYETYQEAVKAANAAKAKKIASLKKQIEKLEKLTF